MTNRNRNALPVYLQIAELIIRDIGAGRLIDGERLPPEREMAMGLNTSVGTLRKALGALTEKGLLERIQGSGNYIRAGKTRNSIYGMFRLELHEGGGLPRADLLTVERVAKPADLPDFGYSDHGARIRRLRYLNDTIIAVEEIWLDDSVGQVAKDTLSDSLYHYYQKQLGIWITRAEDRVGISEVPIWAPSVFTKRPGTPIGFVERFSWADKDLPIEYSRTWFDTDQALYVQRLK
ncbi:GntR family transcriptional regulator [Cognatishimia sp. 1_MG-2023]|uniref:GntR family transcriptional regulator n=1 Tax=Cognatishimia sp. 1_MG-2023 TaxID=3062642 RepID=UPI0026E1F7F5|nr:GntR family transcriptional regulator [Cognatishimia sp. 1_MG-2023]MDO6725535.1 GntR family transcriptional regulator [Cognatishimia sp. 1_MG-2023]